MSFYIILYTLPVNACSDPVAPRLMSHKTKFCGVPLFSCLNLSCVGALGGGMLNLVAL